MALDETYLIEERGRIWAKVDNLIEIRNEHIEIYNESFELWRIKEILGIEQKIIGLMNAVKDIEHTLGWNNSVTDEVIQQYKNHRETSIRIINKAE